MTEPIGEPPPFVPNEERQKLWFTYSAELDRRQLSSSENFDKNVLTLSSAGLALSIGFLKDFVPIEAALWPGALYASWTLFVLATLSTMGSFLASSRAQERQKTLAHRGYMLGIEGAFKEPNGWAAFTRALNRVSAGAFVVALTCTTVFFAINLDQSQRMNNRNIKPASSLVERGAPVPTMHRPLSPAPVPAPVSTPAPVPNASGANKP